MKLEDLMEAPYSQLYNNTVSKFPQTNRKQTSARVQVFTTAFVPSNNSLEIRAKTRTKKSTYDSIIFLPEVEYVNNEENPNAISFQAPDGSDYYIEPIMQNSEVQVFCSCPDFHWRFATWNDKANSLYGTAPSPYIKKTDRMPVNPSKSPGLCKHLMKLFDFVKQERIIR